MIRRSSTIPRTGFERVLRMSAAEVDVGASRGRIAIVIVRGERYGRPMKSQTRSLLLLLAAFGVIAGPIRGAEDPLKDPDLQEMLKEAKELEKQAGPAKPAKLSDLKKQADEIAAEQKKEEAKEKAALKKRLEKQLAEPEPTKFPDWMPATPEFKAAGAPSKKIVDDEVRLIQTGTSSVKPRDLLTSWEKAVEGKPLNHFSNDTTSNGDVTTRLDISTRNETREKVVLEAKRGANEKITQITIASPMPKPDGEDASSDDE
jgi:ribosomal protein L12E/L44/L45/RPP1/RPP2